MQFQFKDTRKSLEVLGADGEVEKTFQIDVGSYDQLILYSDLLAELKGMEMDTEADPTRESIDALVKSYSEIIPKLLGDVDSWDFLWNLSNKNILSMTYFSRKIVDFIEEQKREVRKAYV